MVQRVRLLPNIPPSLSSCSTTFDCLLSPSALPLLTPGLCTTVNLKGWRSNDHLIRRPFSSLHYADTANSSGLFPLQSVHLSGTL